MSSTQPAVPSLHNTVGDTVPIVTDDQGNQRAAPPNGRLVVAAGQIIASAWGNTTYDQSFMTFANAADRTNQWPVPNEGGLSFLMDSRTPWIYRQGAWRGLPLGFMGSAVGPANQTNIASNTSVTLLTVTMNLVLPTRQYRVTGYAAGTATTATAMHILISNSQNVPSTYLNQDSLSAPAPAGSTRIGAGAILFSPATTSSIAFYLVFQSYGGTTAVAANSTFLLVEDIGG